MERLSIELTDRCAKACGFCYARARPSGSRSWRAEDAIALVRDCAAHRTRAVSFGGGEPLEYPPLFEVLEATRGRVFRSITTNGLLLESALDELVGASPEKVHVSVHDPADEAEVGRAARQVAALEAREIRAGVNLLVRRSGLDAARAAGAALRRSGVGRDRVIWLPMRPHDTPSARELADVAGGPFQSATCITGCAPSPRFASLAADASVAPCSYTPRRVPLRAFTHAALAQALGEATRRLEPCSEDT